MRQHIFQFTVLLFFLYSIATAKITITVGNSKVVIHHRSEQPEPSGVSSWFWDPLQRLGLKDAHMPMSKRIPHPEAAAFPAKKNKSKGCKRACRRCSGNSIAVPGDCTKCKKCPAGKNPNRAGTQCQSLKERQKEKDEAEKKENERKFREEKKKKEQEEKKRKENERKQKEQKQKEEKKRKEKERKEKERKLREEKKKEEKRRKEKAKEDKALREQQKKDDQARAKRQASFAEKQQKKQEKYDEWQKRRTDNNNRNKVRRMAKCLFLAPLLMPPEQANEYADEFFDEAYLESMDLLQYWPEDVPISPWAGEKDDAILESPEFVDRWNKGVSDSSARSLPVEDETEPMHETLRGNELAIRPIDSSRTALQLANHDLEERFLMFLIPIFTALVSVGARVGVAVARTVPRIVNAVKRVPTKVAKGRSNRRTNAERNAGARKIADSRGWKNCLRMKGPPA